MARDAAGRRSPRRSHLGLAAAAGSRSVPASSIAEQSSIPTGVEAFTEGDALYVCRDAWFDSERSKRGSHGKLHLRGRRNWRAVRSGPDRARDGRCRCTIALGRRRRREWARARLRGESRSTASGFAGSTAGAGAGRCVTTGAITESFSSSTIGSPMSADSTFIRKVHVDSTENRAGAILMPRFRAPWCATRRSCSTDSGTATGRGHRRRVAATA